MTRGSSLAIAIKTPPITMTSKEGLKPEYEPQHYIDMYVKDQDGGNLVSTRGMLDSGSQGSCVNRNFSHDVLTKHHLKPIPTTVIMADGNNSRTGPITHYNRVTARIAGHEEQLALDTTSLSHPIILGMPWHKKHNPNIDYLNNTLTFASEYCHTNCSHCGRTIPLHSSDQEHPVSGARSESPSVRHHAETADSAETQTAETTVTPPAPSQIPQPGRIPRIAPAKRRLCPTTRPDQNPVTTGGNQRQKGAEGGTTLIGGNRSLSKGKTPPVMLV